MFNIGSANSLKSAPHPCPSPRGRGVLVQSLSLNDLLDESKCYEEARRKRWPYGVRCPCCTSNKINPRGQNYRRQACRRYSCKNGSQRFDDLTGTIFMGRRPPLSVWLAYLYLIGLNLSNRQMAQKLNLAESDSQAMAEPLRGGIVQRRSPVRMSGVVECDEVSVVAGHKGRPDPIKGRVPRRRRLQGAPGRGTRAKEKPPIFGMIERGGAVEPCWAHSWTPFAAGSMSSKSNMSQVDF